jgi:hypothetical protein
MIVSMALAFLAASAAPADSPAPAQAAPAAKKVKEKKICVYDAETTGSLMRTKICKTKAEWDAETAREQSTGPLRHSSAPALSGDSN